MKFVSVGLPIMHFKEIPIHHVQCQQLESHHYFCRFVTPYQMAATTKILIDWLIFCCHSQVFERAK
jgi:hypothetical protein